MHRALVALLLILPRPVDEPEDPGRRTGHGDVLVDGTAVIEETSTQPFGRHQPRGNRPQPPDFSLLAFQCLAAGGQMLAQLTHLDHVGLHLLLERGHLVRGLLAGAQQGGGNQDRLGGRRAAPGAQPGIHLGLRANTSDMRGRAFALRIVHGAAPAVHPG